MDFNFVRTSYAPDDVTILLQDVKGKIPVLDTAEREKLNQSGVHYSEMLPLEYKPTAKYMEMYAESLETMAEPVADSVIQLAAKIMLAKKNAPVLVSLARAGTPIGILLKRYIKYAYGVDAPHYSISIVRGKGIDVIAMEHIVSMHSAKDIVFVDGWVGKGAINAVLHKACKALKASVRTYAELDDTLAVLSDPAGITALYGTTDDFLLPSACLNATVSGLISRTVNKAGVTSGSFDGAIYYEEYEHMDRSIEFLETIEQKMIALHPKYKDIVVEIIEPTGENKGLAEIKQIAIQHGVKDINKIKPGVGETTRVLLRRVPDLILIDKKVCEPNSEGYKYIKHILRLCEEKGVEWRPADLKQYRTCGIIKDLADL